MVVVLHTAIVKAQRHISYTQRYIEALRYIHKYAKQATHAERHTHVYHMLQKQEGSYTLLLGIPARLQRALLISILYSSSIVV